MGFRFRPGSGLDEFARVKQQDARSSMKNMFFILNFHGLGEPSRDIPLEEEPFWVEVPFFEAVLDLIQGRDDVQITFDDSNASDYEVALPALKARSMTAKIFVLAQQVDQKGYLSTHQLREMSSRGLTVGSHGMRHCPWTGLDDQALHVDLVEAKNRLEQITGRPVTEAACPFGNYDRRVLRAVKNSGYNKIYTSDDFPAFADSWVQSRYTILRTHDVPQVAEIINGMPRGLARAWPRMKLKWKQLR